jgi:transposase
MAGVLRIWIEESVETLKALLDEQRDAVSRSKVQMLWWIKTQQLSSVNAMAQMSGYHRTTVSRWLSAYRQGGLEALLAVQPKPGRPPKIRGEVRERLERELEEPEGFGSYKEVQHWLRHWSVKRRCIETLSCKGFPGLIGDESRGLWPSLESFVSPVPSAV